MLVCGFTFIRNAVKYDYNIVESISSILPICDEFVVAVGKCDDGTLELIKSIHSPKIKIIETQWDENADHRVYHVFAQETDKAFQAIDKKFDWAFYIQGDEVVHEKYLPTIREAMEKYQDDQRIDGLLFKYKHFYGSFDYVGYSSAWYAYEIRVIKNDKSIYSYRDAQGFRKGNNQKLNVIAIPAYIYHYGWVRHPKTMSAKQTNFSTFYGSSATEQDIWNAGEFDYEKHMSQLKKFVDTHPQVMQARITRLNWTFDGDIAFERASVKDKVKRFLYKYLGINTYYTNYKKIRG